jgi:hypothetical protein
MSKDESNVTSCPGPKTAIAPQPSLEADIAISDLLHSSK